MIRLFRLESDFGKSLFKNVSEMKAYNCFAKDFEFVHVANERVATGNKSRDQAYLKHLCAMGMLPGISDYLILGKRMWGALELKRDKSSKLTKTQERFKERCEELEAPYLCTYDYDEALDFLRRTLA